MNKQSKFAARAALSVVAVAAAIPVTAWAQAAGVETANPYGLDALWKNGDFVARFVLLVLVAMSMGSWYIMVTKFVEQARQSPREVGGSAALGSAVARGRRGATRRTLAVSLHRRNRHRRRRASRRSTARRSGSQYVDSGEHRPLDQQRRQSPAGLAFLATVGSTAPFVGLFGTVWGIYHALTAIGIAGQASIDKVAGPVGEALIMTAIGLAVAAGRARLQLPRAPQQVADGARAHVRRATAYGAAVGPQAQRARRRQRAG
jgi:biopolymer transport protein ExbB